MKLTSNTLFPKALKGSPGQLHMWPHLIPQFAHFLCKETFWVLNINRYKVSEYKLEKFLIKILIKIVVHTIDKRKGGVLSGGRKD